MAFIRQAGVLKRVGICNSDSKIFDGNIVATSTIVCKYVQDRPSNTPEIATVKTALFWKRRQKSAYSTKYLNNCWTDLHQTFSVSSHVYEDYKTDICFVVAQGILLW